ncbi:MAG: hypothetical protein WCX74_04445, partial [Candidatus Paceibacterota bacterium]
VMLNNSATPSRSSAFCPHPIAFPFYFSLAGGILFFGMSDGARSGFFKEETAEFKIQIQNRAFVHHIILCRV